MWRIFRRRTADRPAATPAGRQDCDVCGEQSGHGLLGCPIEAARQEDAAWIRGGASLGRRL